MAEDKGYHQWLRRQRSSLIRGPSLTQNPSSKCWKDPKERAEHWRGIPLSPGIKALDTFKVLLKPFSPKKPWPVTSVWGIFLSLSPSVFSWNQCYYVILSSISAFSASWLCLLLHLLNGILGSLTTQTISIFIIFIVCNTALDPG